MAECLIGSMGGGKLGKRTVALEPAAKLIPVEILFQRSNYSDVITADCQHNDNKNNGQALAGINLHQSRHKQIRSFFYLHFWQTAKVPIGRLISL